MRDEQENELLNAALLTVEIALRRHCLPSSVGHVIDMDLATIMLALWLSLARASVVTGEAV